MAEPVYDKYSGEKIRHEITGKKIRDSVTGEWLGTQRAFVFATDLVDDTYLTPSTTPPIPTLLFNSMYTIVLF